MKKKALCLMAAMCMAICGVIVYSDYSDAMAASVTHDEATDLDSVQSDVTSEKSSKKFSSNDSEYVYERDGIPGLDGSLTLEMGRDDFEAGLEYEDIKYDVTTDIIEGIPFFTRYKVSALVTADNEDGVIPQIQLYFDGSDAEYSDIIDRLKKTVSEPLVESDVFDPNTLYKYIYWDLDDTHCMLLYIEYNNTLYIDFELVDPERRKEYEQCMENISTNEELSEAYDMIRAHLDLLEGSIQEAIDKYGAEWDSSTDSFVYFKENGELFGYSGYIDYTLQNPDRDDFSSDFAGQITNSSIGFHFDESVDDDDDICEKLTEMFGEYTVKTSNDSEYYQWDNSAYDIVFYPSVPSVGVSLNKDFYLVDPEMITELNDAAEKLVTEPVDKEILQLPDYEKTKGVVTDNSTRNELWEKAQEEVLEALKAPASAEFPEMKRPTNSLAENGDVSITHSGSLYYVSSYVDSQNSFGAMLRTEFVVIFEKGEHGFTCLGVNFGDDAADVTESSSGFSASGGQRRPQN